MGRGEEEKKTQQKTTNLKKNDAKAVTHQQTNAQPVSENSYFGKTPLPVLLLTRTIQGREFMYRALSVGVALLAQK